MPLDRTVVVFLPGPDGGCNMDYIVSRTSLVGLDVACFGESISQSMEDRTFWKGEVEDG